MRDTKTCFVSRPPLSRLRRRFAPLRGALRRYAALRAALSTALRAGALRAQLFYKHEKKADNTHSIYRCKMTNRSVH